MLPFLLFNQWRKRTKKLFFRLFIVAPLLLWLGSFTYRFLKKFFRKDEPGGTMVAKIKQIQS